MLRPGLRMMREDRRQSIAAPEPLSQKLLGFLWIVIDTNA
jgi:hypothetical protein